MSDSRGPGGDEPSRAEVARRALSAVGGRYSAELGIDVDAGAPEIERWFLAATLFGNRISSRVAERTFRVLEEAGVTRVSAARRVPWDQLVQLLDAGGYARYDYRTATRLQALAEALDERWDGRISALSARARSPAELEAALDALPGWGPVTVRLFLRELRGVWPHADPPLDDRTRGAASHLGLLEEGREPELADLRSLAVEAGLDVRDLESALVRLSLDHHNRYDGCPGGGACHVLHRGRSDGGR